MCARAIAVCRWDIVRVACDKTHVDHQAITSEGGYKEFDQHHGALINFIGTLEAILVSTSQQLAATCTAVV